MDSDYITAEQTFGDWDIIIAEQSFVCKQVAGFVCPDCSQQVQPGFAINQVSCSCGCIFCARCRALYISVPVDTDAVLSQVGSSRLATCSCEAVDRLAVAARWGSAAVACWPAGAPQQQLLLLHLLLAYESSVIPLLSRQLLEQLHSVGGMLRLDAVEQVAHRIQQQQQQQQQHTTDRDELKQPQSPKDNAQQISSDFIPTDATPSFAFNGRAGTPTAGDAMDMDHVPSPAAAAAVAAVAMKKADTAVQTCSEHDDPRSMQLDPQHQLHSSQRRQQQQVGGSCSAAAVPVTAPSPEQEGVQELPTAGLQPDVGVAEASDALEAEQLQQLAAGVADVKEQSEATEAAEPQLQRADSGPGSPSAQPISTVTQLQQEQRSAWQALPNAAVDEPQQQLGFDDLVQQQPEPMQQDLEQVKVQGCLPHHHLISSVALPGASGVLPGKGGRLRLVAGDVDAGRDGNSGSSNQPASAAAAAAALPQLADFGLRPEAPPVLADEPVVLLPAAHDDTAQAEQIWRMW